MAIEIADPGELEPKLCSRDVAAQVLLRDSRSIRRAVNASKRASAEAGTVSTFATSPSTAAATALQKSTSKPRQAPDPSFSEKPGRPPLTPQIGFPRARTSSSVPADTLCSSGECAAPEARPQLRRATSTWRPTSCDFKPCCQPNQIGKVRRELPPFILHLRILRQSLRNKLCII